MFVKTKKIKGTDYVYIMRSVRKKGYKYPVQETVQCLGKLEDRTREDPEFLGKLREKLSGPEDRVIVELVCSRDRSDSSVRIGNLPVEAAIKRMGLLRAFEGIGGKASYDVSEISRDLISERIINPASKLSSYEGLSTERLSAPKYKLHDIYRALQDMGRNLGVIVGRFTEISRKGRETNVAYYDTTNFYFEIQQEAGLKQYGISKEHRPNPIVQMGLFVDQDGFPIAMNVNPGNTGESLTAVPTQKSMSSHGVSSYIYCADAGIGSGEIKLYNNCPGRRYIVAQSIKKMAKGRMEWALSDSGWKDTKGRPVKSTEDCPKGGFIWKEDIFKLVVKQGNAKTEIAERTIVIYSGDTKKWQDTILDEQVGRAMKKVQNGLTENPNSPNRFVDVTKVTDDGEVAETEVRSLAQDKVDDEKKFHGFYAIATNIIAREMKAMDIICINAGRWRVEDYFRNMKSTIDTRPIFLQCDDSIRAHLLICMMAVYVMMTIGAELQSKGIASTPSDIQEALQGMQAIERKAGYELVNIKGSEKIDSIRKGIESVYGLEALEKEAMLHKTMKALVKMCRE